MVLLAQSGLQRVWEYPRQVAAYSVLGAAAELVCTAVLMSA